ncbi:MAG TPA: hypothetical protein VHV75_10200 [Solirubrobacteraceae bacterium]|nr:hypothetical protein [Solirubrobacteraceae bacterium]
MSSSSDRAARQEDAFDGNYRDRVLVKVTMLAEERFKPVRAEMLMSAFVDAGAAAGRCHGRLAAAEFQFCSRSAQEPAAVVGERIRPLIRLAATLLLAGHPDGDPEVVMHTADWPAKPPCLAVLRTDKAHGFTSDADEWEVL